MILIFLIAAISVFILLISFSTLTLLESISVSLFIYFFLKFIDDIGKRMAILDIAAIIAIFTWLVMPVIFYHYYTYENTLARIWIVYMPIDSNRYFLYIIPGTLAFIAGMMIPIFRSQVYKDPRTFISLIREQVKGQSTTGFLLIGIGIASGLLRTIVPGAVTQILVFTQQLTHVGMLIVFFSDSFHKVKVLTIVFLLDIFTSIQTGMFGNLVYYLILTFVIILLTVRISFFRKLTIAITGIFFILAIQSLKSEYRTYTWYQGNDASAEIFGQLLFKYVSHPELMLDENKMFGIATRLNQGLLIAKTMNNVPDKYPFGDGSYIVESYLAALIPRIAWPDKPEAGGAYNLERFLGLKDLGYSMNISPIGEAYANFDEYWGIVFMHFYGLTISFIFHYILKLSDKDPKIVLWIPFLFLYTVVVETDILTNLTYLVKGIIFYVIVKYTLRWTLKVEV